MNCVFIFASICICSALSLPTKDAKRNGSKENIDAIEEIIKLSAKVGALEERMKNEEVVIKDKTKEILGLHQDVDYQQNVIKRLYGKVTGLNGKVAELGGEVTSQGNIIRNQSSEIREKSSEIKVLRGEVDNQEKILQNQSKDMQEKGKQIKDLRGDVIIQGNILKNQSKDMQEKGKQIKGISTKVDNAQTAIERQSTQIEDLEKMRTDVCEVPVPYPKESPQKIAKTCYRFDGGNTVLKFVGYGHYGSQANWEQKTFSEFGECINWCKGKRDSNANWDALWYRKSGGTCECMMTGRGFSPNNIDIYYHF